MADGALTITITGEDAAKLEERARVLGLAPEPMVLDMIGRMIDDGEGLDRSSTSPTDYDGPYVELEDALTGLNTELELRLAARHG